MEQENCIAKRIVVKSDEKKMYLYDDDTMIEMIDEVYFGKNGVVEEKQEGDMCTPKGVYPLGFAFGTHDLKIAYPYYRINESTYWVSDSDSKYYNEWVELAEKEKTFSYPYMKMSKEIAWCDAEHLCDYPIQYELAIVIEYNINPKEKNKGSAIFLHVKNKEYTAGCISTSKANMEYILKWLGKAKGTIEIK